MEYKQIRSRVEQSMVVLNGNGMEHNLRDNRISTVGYVASTKRDGSVMYYTNRLSRKSFNR